MTLKVFDLDPETYVPHRLHQSDRSWTETNCWQDMMIEVVHALGLEPLAACAFTLSSDFEGEQWTLFKFPPEDLRSLFGLEVEEIYVWRPVIDHLEESLTAGNLLTVEVDAWFLPDTAGITYHSDHVKTGVVPQLLDRTQRKIGYFHNAGYFQLEDEDFDGIFYLEQGRDPRILLPYVEVIKLDRLIRLGADELLEQSTELVRAHLKRRAESNPMPRFRERLEKDLAWLAEQGESAFHSYAFANCRQCGANAEVASAYVDWLGRSQGVDLSEPAGDLRSISEAAKSLQFALARVARGRRVDLDATFKEMERGWDSAMDVLASRYDA